jgi:hypothetical protein
VIHGYQPGHMTCAATIFSSDSIAFVSVKFVFINSESNSRSGKYYWQIDLVLKHEKRIHLEKTSSDFVTKQD